MQENNLEKVLIFHNNTLNCVCKIFNYRAFLRDVKRKIFIIVHYDNSIDVRDFGEYSFIGEYLKKKD